MIWNVIDRRKRRYRWKRVNAIIEAVEHDNSCADADVADELPPGLTIDYASRDDVSVHEAIQWANQQRCPVTLYIYDADDGIIPAHFHACGERFWQDDMSDL
ncbi:hypothetical protein [Rhizobium lusitanum]|uniref:Uncharacterized protein n=1 Tax=Rhizobium lusitanum TaxID=293958 RepID=A0A7X0M9Y1_9HYPH|nr:hypothetical protein [Rhizobium lusitanum]MBB6483202.1 hypothetical protein [Rhizobium lusitanum]